MKKITYGAPRLVDWVAQIKAGSASVRVHFTGGALTSYGVTPAEYTTDNPFIQKVIEQSTYFKEGRITLIRSTEIADKVKPVKTTKGKPKQSETTTTKATESNEEVITNEPDQRTSTQEEVTAEVAPSESEATDETTPPDLTKIEANCLQDAQAYLQENFGIASYKVRSYDAAQRAALEHGVVFVGEKFT